MNQTPTIYQPPGRSVWMMKFYVQENGKSVRKRKSTGTTDEAEAQKKLADELRAIANDKDGIREYAGKEKEKLTVRDLLDALDADYLLREIKGYSDSHGRIRKGSPLSEFFGACKVRAVSAALVKAYIAERREAGRKNATINRELELLSAAYALAVKTKAIPEMWTPTIDSLPEKNVRRGFFEESDLETLLPLLPTPLDDVARFGYLCGWRRGEVLSLTWDRVTKERVLLDDSKNGEPRSLRLDAELVELFDRRRAGREYVTATGSALSAYVFHRNGKPINKTVFGKQWRKACQKVGLAGKLFHDFRRTAARNMVRGGVPETVAMTITGHKTRAMFDRYNITDDADQLKALEQSRAYREAHAAEGSNVVAMRSK